MNHPNEVGPSNSNPLKFGGTALYVNNVSAALAFYNRAFGLNTRFFDAALEYGELETGTAVVAFATQKTGEFLMPGRYVRSESMKSMTNCGIQSLWSVVCRCNPPPR